MTLDDPSLGGSKDNSTVVPPDNHITRCIGYLEYAPPEAAPFPQVEGQRHQFRGAADKSHIMMVEYLPGGNLTAFCQCYMDRIMSPNREDRLDFWHQMFHLLQGVAALHVAEWHVN